MILGFLCGEFLLRRFQLEVIMVTREDVAQMLRSTFTEGRVAPMFGLSEQPDLNDDLQRFSRLYICLAEMEAAWPSVFVGINEPNDDAQSKFRPVPISVEFDSDAGIHPEQAVELLKEEFLRASKLGLPAEPTPLPAARDGFFEGLTDTILSRIKWLNNSAAAGSSLKPKVTVISSPGNQQVYWTKGYFFSVGAVFGNTKHTRDVTPGRYSVWLRGTTPTPSTIMPWDINQDETVPL